MLTSFGFKKIEKCGILFSKFLYKNGVSNFPEIFNLNRWILLKLNQFICNQQAAGSPRSLVSKDMSAT